MALKPRGCAVGTDGVATIPRSGQVRFPEEAPHSGLRIQRLERPALRFVRGIL